MFQVTDPVENMAFNIIENTATLTESSMAVAARTSVGMPLETP